MKKCMTPIASFALAIATLIGLNLSLPVQAAAENKISVEEVYKMLEEDIPEEQIVQELMRRGLTQNEIMEIFQKCMEYTLDKGWENSQIITYFEDITKFDPAVQKVARICLEAFKSQDNNYVKEELLKVIKNNVRNIPDQRVWISIGEYNLSLGWRKASDAFSILEVDIRQMNGRSAYYYYDYSSYRVEKGDLQGTFIAYDSACKGWEYNGPFQYTNINEYYPDSNRAAIITKASGIAKDDLFYKDGIMDDKHCMNWCEQWTKELTEEEKEKLYTPIHQIWNQEFIK